MKPGTTRIVIGFLVGIFLLAGFLSILLPKPIFYVPLAIFFLLFLLIVIFVLLFWRCAYCHRLLPPQGLLLMERCPYCGEKIE